MRFVMTLVAILSVSACNNIVETRSAEGSSQVDAIEGEKGSKKGDDGEPTSAEIVTVESDTPTNSGSATTGEITSETSMTTGTTDSVTPAPPPAVQSAGEKLEAYISSIKDNAEHNAACYARKERKNFFGNKCITEAECKAIPAIGGKVYSGLCGLDYRQFSSNSKKRNLEIKKLCKDNGLVLELFTMLPHCITKKMCLATKTFNGKKTQVIDDVCSFDSN